MKVNELSFTTRLEYAQLLYEEEFGKDTWCLLPEENRMLYALNDHFIQKYLDEIESGRRSALPLFSDAFKDRIKRLGIASMKELSNVEYCANDIATCIGIFYDDHSYVLITGAFLYEEKYMFNTVTLLRSSYAPFMYNDAPLYATPLCGERVLYYMTEDTDYDGTKTVNEIIDELERKKLIRFASVHVG